MEHPLENPSLTPFGFVTPNCLKRIKQDLKGFGSGINGDREISLLWAKVNRLQGKKPYPAEDIIHKIMPSQKLKNRKIEGDFTFDGKPYLARDIIVLSTIIAWFGSNGGQAFIHSPPPKETIHPVREYLDKFQLENGGPDYKKDLVATWLHECGPNCFSQHCNYTHKPPSERDRDVVNALLWWLGNKEGRAFVETHTKRIERLHKQFPETLRVSEKIVA